MTKSYPCLFLFVLFCVLDPNFGFGVEEGKERALYEELRLHKEDINEERHERSLIDTFESHNGLEGGEWALDRDGRTYSCNTLGKDKCCKEKCIRHGITNGYCYYNKCWCKFEDDGDDNGDGDNNGDDDDEEDGTEFVIEDVSEPTDTFKSHMGLEGGEWALDKLGRRYICSPEGRNNLCSEMCSRHGTTNGYCFYKKCWCKLWEDE